jgi:hypothetical protein
MGRSSYRTAVPADAVEGVEERHPDDAAAPAARRRVWYTGAAIVRRWV